MTVNVRITCSIDLDIPDLGRVTVVPMRRARNITLRSRLSGYRVSVPYGITMTDLMTSLSRMIPRLAGRESATSRPKFHIGQTISLPDVTVNIAAAQSGRKGLKVTRAGKVVTVTVGSDSDLSDPLFQQAINRLIIKGVTYGAADILLPRAIRLAAEAGVSVSAWKVGSGKRTLGTCSVSGVITLSAMLMFLPLHLRDYVVWHELAHRTHMNHSPRFHSLCDAYCGGREKALVRELKQFRWAVIR
ncbi:MAG: M48 family metallopeptidase [Paramuribaculum sp.]|nr:M48 family metallopeptidase [Paramuribaculum sp.]